MKLSKKAEYALRALTAMGKKPMGRSFSIQELAIQEKIPVKFLEQILLSLKNGGLLRSKRGVGGGYQMLISSTEISLQQVIDLIDGSFVPIPCCDHINRPQSACECGQIGGCSLARTLQGLQQQMQTWLSQTTIAHIINNEQASQNLGFEI